MEKIKVIIYGCGVMGRGVGQALQKKNRVEIVGAVDESNELIGKDLGRLFEDPVETGIRIAGDASTLFQAVQADAVVLTTTSYLKDVFSQIEQCVRSGLNVISTCEELSYPWKQNPDLARKIDELSKAHHVTVLGTGINPGYLMDTLPLFLTAPCLAVKSVKVVRMMDSSKRRIPFQKKVGTGLTTAQFRRMIENGEITGHVGLVESVNLIAAGLQWELDEAVELPPQPVIAEKEIKTAVGTVKPGHVMGLTSIAHGRAGGRDVITLEFNAHAGVDRQYDEVFIEGLPGIHQRIIGGVHGDTGTVAVTVNTIPRVVEAPPGLVLMKDMPVFPAVN